jgi:hypothetical protein
MIYRPFLSDLQSSIAFALRNKIHEKSFRDEAQRGRLTIFIIPRHFVFLLHQVQENVLQHHDLEFVLKAHPAEKVVVVISDLLSGQILAVRDTKVSERLEDFPLERLDVAVQEVEQRLEYFITDI